MTRRGILKLLAGIPAVLAANKLVDTPTAKRELPGARFVEENIGNWTKKSDWTGVVYSGGTFIAMTAGNTVLTSHDGYTWTQKNAGHR